MVCIEPIASFNAGFVNQMLTLYKPDASQLKPNANAVWTDCQLETGSNEPIANAMNLMLCTLCVATLPNALGFHFSRIAKRKAEGIRCVWVNIDIRGNNKKM